MQGKAQTRSDSYDAVRQRQSAQPRAHFCNARSCTNPLNGAIPDPDAAIKMSTEGSAGG